MFIMSFDCEREAYDDDDDDDKPGRVWTRMQRKLEGNLILVLVHLKDQM